VPERLTGDAARQFLPKSGFRVAASGIRLPRNSSCFIIDIRGLFGAGLSGTRLAADLVILRRVAPQDLTGNSEPNAKNQ
jgi:hypothetical protein